MAHHYFSEDAILMAHHYFSEGAILMARHHHPGGKETGNMNTIVQVVSTVVFSRVDLVRRSSMGWIA